MEFVEYNGGYAEYNSPTYTFVALRETERILQLVHSNAKLLDSARKLHAFIWGEIAKRFHPATCQLGGAQSRAYAEYLPEGIVDLLRNATGLPVSIAENPLACVVKGTGTALDNLSKFKNVLSTMY